MGGGEAGFPTNNIFLTLADDPHSPLHLFADLFDFPEEAERLLLLTEEEEALLALLEEAEGALEPIPPMEFTLRRAFDPLPPPESNEEEAEW